MHDKVGFVAEVTKSFCQKAEVAMPEKLVRADSKVGVEEDFQILELTCPTDRAEPLITSGFQPSQNFCRVNSGGMVLRASTLQYNCSIIQTKNLSDQINPAVEENIRHPVQNSATRRTEDDVGHVATKEATNICSL